MMPARIILTVALLSALGIAEATADCQIADAKLEEAILKKPDLRAPANGQIVRDLRSLRDAAFILRSYGRHDDCERLLANIRERTPAAWPRKDSSVELRLFNSIDRLRPRVQCK